MPAAHEGYDHNVRGESAGKEESGEPPGGAVMGRFDGAEGDGGMIWYSPSKADLLLRIALRFAMTDWRIHSSIPGN